jgi:hypothetical protein
MVRFRHLALIFLFLSPAVAKDEVPLDGEAYLIDEVCAGGVKSDTCILSFQIRGKAAELLFDGMRAKAVQDEACTGGMVKSGGNSLYCNKDADGTFCEFGYSFSEDDFTFGGEVC